MLLAKLADSQAQALPASADGRSQPSGFAKREDSAYKDFSFRGGSLRGCSEGKGWRKMDRIETSQLINGGTIALALGALSLALGYTEIFLLLAAAGVFAYGVVLVRYFKKRSAKREGDAPER
jgi:hypothetical protein